MVCEEKIMEMERRLGRKLTFKEKKEVERRMHHCEEHKPKREEEENLITA